jgi:hypothetical protein
MVGVLQDQVPGQGLWRHRFEAGEADAAIDSDEPARRFGQEQLRAPAFGMQTRSWTVINNSLASGGNWDYVCPNR